MKKTASQIYKQQNLALHKAFAALGRPYREHQDIWLLLCSEICRRRIGGLSEMTLAERHALVKELHHQGARVFSPAVPKAVAGWKKGLPDVDFAFSLTKCPKLRMAYSLWGELGYEPAKLRGMVKKRYRVDHEKFLSPAQRDALVNYLQARLRGRSEEVRYYR